jgi:regulator of extracellular matrix RemA (YlzA/DUF370 family)
MGKNMKPSIKNKLSADKIEAANRELNESKPTAASAKPTVEAKKDVEMVKNAVYTEGSPEVVVAPKVKVEAKAIAPKTVARVGEKPSRRSKIAILAEEENLRLVRVTIDIPEDLHEKMKIKMILTKQTMKDYLLDFIRKDVGNTNFGYK